jgi:cytochrome P450
MGAAMSRYERPPFNINDLNGKTDEESNALIFDWWCDEGDLDDGSGNPRTSDRLLYIRSLRGVARRIPSRAPHQNDPAPPITVPAPEGFRDVYLLSGPNDLHHALTNTTDFNNLPYAALGGASFLLGLDPGPGDKGVDWHLKQRALVDKAFAAYPAIQLRLLASKAVEQAALTSLDRPYFDMAEFAAQAALRYAGVLFGYGFQDHTLLQAASTATYRALQYLAIGQHFITEPETLPAAQQALGCLVARTSELMEEYTRLERSPRRYGPKPRRKWPTGVQPWSELGFSPLGEPVLKRLPGIADPPANPSRQTLSGRDRAIVAATMIAGTLGNIQSAVCLLLQFLLDPLGGKAERAKIEKMDCDAALEAFLLPLLDKFPPVPVLPRRTRVKVSLNHGVTIPADTDCLLLLEGATPCQHTWGDVKGGGPAPHECLGYNFSLPLIAALVHRTLNLPEVRVALDPLNGETLKVQRLWGFSCTRYALIHDQEQSKQQNLIICMRVKPPISENAKHLRRLIAAGVPRIEHVLTSFQHLHFAWFEFTEDERELVLRTVYDGQFESYVQHFALYAGDLFDGLFEYLEGAPPRPVAEHPQEFVEALRLLNRSPLGGYLYSAYPRVEANQIRQRFP